MSIQILDIYSGNRVNFEQEKATGTDGIFLKGGQGEWPDVPRVHPEWFEQIDALGIPRGIYWQMDARYSPEKHKAAIKNLFPTGNFGKLGLWLAVELPFYPMPDLAYWLLRYSGYKMIESVWRGVFAYTGKYPGIYTSISKWNLIFAGCPPELKAEFAEKCKLWVAQYKVSKPDKIGAWGENYTFWQYMENPDYNIYNGTSEQFSSEFAGGVTIPPEEPPIIIPPTGDNMKYEGKVKSTATAGVNVRATPGGTDIGDLAANTPITGDNLFSLSGFTWMHILTPQAGYVRSDLLEYHEVIENPVPTGEDININVNRSGGVTTVTVDGDVYKKQ